MIWAATLGLPLSLKDVGAVLWLDRQKLEEGKDLIRYFCIPCKATKSNGGRTRNLPADAPEKWKLFTEYNKRDVETEMAIQARLKKFPVPESEWENYVIDQEINDRGISVDTTFVAQAIRCAARRPVWKEQRNSPDLKIQILRCSLWTGCAGKDSRWNLLQRVK